MERNQNTLDNTPGATNNPTDNHTPGQEDHSNIEINLPTDNINATFTGQQDLQNLNMNPEQPVDYSGFQNRTQEGSQHSYLIAATEPSASQDQQDTGNQEQQTIPQQTIPQQTSPQQTIPIQRIQQQSYVPPSIVDTELEERLLAQQKINQTMALNFNIKKEDLANRLHGYLDHPSGDTNNTANVGSGDQNHAGGNDWGDYVQNNNLYQQNKRQLDDPFGTYWDGQDNQGQDQNNLAQQSILSQSDDVEQDSDTPFDSQFTISDNKPTSGLFRLDQIAEKEQQQRMINQQGRDVFGGDDPSKAINQEDERLRNQQTYNNILTQQFLANQRNEAMRQTPRFDKSQVYAGPKLGKSHKQKKPATETKGNIVQKRADKNERKHPSMGGSSSNPGSDFNPISIGESPFRQTTGTLDQSSNTSRREALSDGGQPSKRSRTEDQRQLNNPIYEFNSSDEENGFPLEDQGSEYFGVERLYEILRDNQIEFKEPEEYPIEDTYMFRRYRDGTGTKERYPFSMATKQQLPSRMIQLNPQNCAAGWEQAIACVCLGFEKLAKTFKAQNGRLPRGRPLNLQPEANLFIYLLQSLPHTKAIIDGDELVYIPLNWPTKSVITCVHKILTSVLGDISQNHPGLKALFPHEENIETIKSLIANLCKLKGKNTNEPVTTAASRTQLAILIGFGLSGGFKAMQAQTCLPPTIWQLDKHFIENRMRHFLGYVGCKCPEQDFEALLQRNVRYVRDRLNQDLNQRANPTAKRDNGKVRNSNTVWFLTRTGPKIHPFFAILLGSWMPCPFCFKVCHSNTSINTHLSSCGRNMKDTDEDAKWVGDPKNWSIRDGLSNMFQCPLCLFESEKSDDVLHHLQGESHTRRELLLMGFTRYLANKATLLQLASLEQTRAVDQDQLCMFQGWRYPSATRGEDIEMLGQTDRLSDDAGDVVQKPTTNSYLELILSESSFMREGQTPEQLACVAEFIAQPEICLQHLLRTIQNFLLYSAESRTYVLQGVYDCDQDHALVKCSLDQLHCLATRHGSITQCTSLVYVVFVVSHTQEIGDRKYTHYWLLRYNLIEADLECWDSYSQFGAYVNHASHLTRFIQRTFTVEDASPVLHRITQSYTKGTNCLWNMMKDLICLTAFRNTRVLRRGQETGFDPRIMALGPDKDFGKSHIERIQHMVFELVVQRNKRLIRRLYGKDCTFKFPNYSFCVDLTRAATGACDGRIVFQIDTYDAPTLAWIETKRFDHPQRGNDPTPTALPFTLVSERSDFRNLDPRKVAEHSKAPTFAIDHVQNVAVGLRELCEMFLSKPDQFHKVLLDCQRENEVLSNLMTQDQLQLRFVSQHVKELRSMLSQPQHAPEVPFGQPQQQDSESIGNVSHNSMLTNNMPNPPSQVQGQGSLQPAQPAVTCFVYYPKNVQDIGSHLKDCISVESSKRLEFNLHTPKHWIALVRDQQKLQPDDGQPFFLEVLCWNGPLMLQYMNAAQEYLEHVQDMIRSEPSVRDRTVYFLLVDIVSVSTIPQIHLLTFNPVSCTMNFTGEYTEESHLQKMMENLAGMAGHYLDVERWTFQQQLVRLQEDPSSNQSRSACILLSLSAAMCTRQPFNIVPVAVTYSSEIVQWAARFANHGNIHLSSATQQLFDTKTPMTISHHVIHSNVAPGQSFTPEIQKKVLVSTLMALPKKDWSRWSSHNHIIQRHVNTQQMLQEAVPIANSILQQQQGIVPQNPTKQPGGSTRTKRKQDKAQSTKQAETQQTQSSQPPQPTLPMYNVLDRPMLVKLGQEVAQKERLKQQRAEEEQKRQQVTMQSQQTNRADQTVQPQPQRRNPNPAPSFALEQTSINVQIAAQAQALANEEQQRLKDKKENKVAQANESRNQRLQSQAMNPQNTVRQTQPNLQQQASTAANRTNPRMPQYVSQSISQANRSLSTPVQSSRGANTPSTPNQAQNPTQQQQSDDETPGGYGNDFFNSVD